ncbi:MAG: peptidyl-prolyl cis-trans isomerase [Candidatus Aenigmarchaeota archaeon]|nr:peptidyl-prolyl cis-trans isomerase [Candidatus Aenigmarchaeota archaeon]
MVSQVHAVHILVKTEEEAKKVLEQLKTGANFGELAMKVSLCPSKRKGGDLGWFGRGMMVKPFENTAFTMEKGETSNPVKTEFGWHIIRVLETR